MFGTNAFFIMVPAIFGLLALAMAAIAMADRSLVAARWAAVGFLFGGLSMLIEGYREPGSVDWLGWGSVAAHVLTLVALMQAFFARHNRHLPATSLIMAGTGMFMLVPNAPWEPSMHSLRVMVQVVCAALILTSLPRLWSFRSATTVDRIAFAVATGAFLTYVGRALLVASFGPNSPADYLEEPYASVIIALHSASAMMGMAVGIVLMLSIGYDMLRGQMAKGELDVLTGLGNRHRLERRVQDDENGRARVGAVLVLDLDHFKAVNDSYGHDAGDEVLRAVGNRLAQLLGEYGCLCRTGGEEFVVLFDDRHCEGLSQLAIAARQAIAAITFTGPLRQLRVTASFGLHWRQEGETVQDAIRRADQAVYFAKTDGRNRVVEVARESGLQVLRAVA